MVVTEVEAREMWDAILAFQELDNDAANAQEVTDLATAQTWFDTNIRPTLLWNNGQSPRDQFNNSLADRVTLEALTETNRARNVIIGREIEIITNRIRSIKAGL